MTEHQPIPELARDTSAETPWSVQIVNEKFKNAVGKWPSLWVEGQISEINMRRAGSVYMTLRDSNANFSVRIVGFGNFYNKAVQLNLQQGDQIVLHGKADYYPVTGSLSLRADDVIKTDTTGLLKAQIDALRKHLKGEGLFDDDRKIPLPEFPKTIGLICAPGARAEGDVERNVNLRWPIVKFEKRYVLVQGAGCPEEVSHAIAELDALPTVDVIIVARGGGSFEDLMGFSDERVVRAVAACHTPVISAIGHEDDWTLIDLVADVRASTPTDAAKRVVPDVMQEQERIKQLHLGMFTLLNTRVVREEQLVQGYSNRPSITNPYTLLEKPLQFVTDAREKLDIGMRRLLDYETATIEKEYKTLTALSPQATLNRGYAVVQLADGAIVNDPNSVDSGTQLRIQVEKGVITATAQ